MVERIEDLLLPNAIVQRIIKEAIPDGFSVAKDARLEISRAASIFVLYLTSTARSLKNQKKTLTPGDIIHALEAMEMENFVEPLKKAMENHKRMQKDKKDKKQQEPTNNSNRVDTESQQDPPVETEDMIVDEVIPESEEIVPDTVDDKNNNE